MPTRTTTGKGNSAKQVGVAMTAAEHDRMMESCIKPVMENALSSAGEQYGPSFTIREFCGVLKTMPVPSGVPGPRPLLRKWMIAIADDLQRQPNADTQMLAPAASSRPDLGEVV